MSDPDPGRRDSARAAEEQSLDLVQRLVMSTIVWVVFGFLTVALAAYLAVRGEADLGRERALGLWVMTGVIGIVAAVATLVINRRKPWHPLVLLGLLPLVISAAWIL
ncbi:hypothetical protein [Microlunatus speluncae]|uniref:hypothetical protein n=1 Tax=Microlunatus speluncae TaxID=2594267 RepID=UPI001266741E|nr:hypothetical protein [Microlunatus speluncae]